MINFAIGDVQGCFALLQKLLDKIRFDPASHRLWFVGDLVNRGDDSAAVLRFVKALGDSAKVVLGNHDLHLLMVAFAGRKTAARDTLENVLQAPDREPLLDWLRQQPLVQRQGNICMVHAGLPPAWSPEQAERFAAEVSGQLRGPDYVSLLAGLAGKEPSQWDSALTGMDRWRYIVNALTRMRYIKPDGSLDFDCKLPLAQAPAELRPWFMAPRQTHAASIVAGHWSALGLYMDKQHLLIDTGAIWGGPLTAVCLEDRQVFSVITE